MLVFIDDSGDPGFKLDKGSSRHFVIACVIFDDDLEAEETALIIKKLRRSLGWTDIREFRFSNCSKPIKLEFLNAVKASKFRIRAIVIDKSIIRSPELRSSKNSFYNYAIKEVLAKSEGHIKNASIRLDGHEDRAYKRAATTYFNRQLNSKTKMVKSLKFVNSKGDNLIQLADMIAGSIMRAQGRKSDNSDYIKIIKKRFEDIWYFK